jgi:hypothetical protein
MQVSELSVSQQTPGESGQKVCSGIFKGYPTAWYEKKGKAGFFSIGGKN